MIATNIMNRIVYGNKEGMPNHKGKSSDKYNDFLDTVFKKDKLPIINKQNGQNIKDTK